MPADPVSSRELKLLWVTAQRPLRFVSTVVLGTALICVALLVVTSALGISDDGLLTVRAHAQAKPPEPIEKAKKAVETLINHLRGRDMPEGIVKTNGRIEATEVDVSAKYPGRLATLTVDEGDEVTAGQVVGTISSPETEAQLRSAQAQVLKARQAKAEAIALIAQRKSELTFSRTDYERGKTLLQKGDIAQQVVDQRRNRFEVGRGGDMLRRMPSVIRRSPRSRQPRLTSNGCNRFWSISCSSRRGADACNIGSPEPARWSPRASAF